MLSVHPVYLGKRPIDTVYPNWWGSQSEYIQIDHLTFWGEQAILEFIWGWFGPGGPRGLQNRWGVAEQTPVGSTPIHPRLMTIMQNCPSQYARLTFYVV